jgi:hypothetical protein
MRESYAGVTSLMDSPAKLNDGQIELLRAVLEEAYRSAHREAWEVEVGATNATHVVSAKSRLALLESLLAWCGTSQSKALRQVAS